MGNIIRVLSAYALAASMCHAAAADDCALKQVASLPVHFENHQMLVEIAVDDIPVNFLIDTGAEYSEIGQALAARLQLPVKNIAGTSYGVGGAADIMMTTVPTLQMGRMTAHGQPFFVDQNFGDGQDGRMAGIFGADFLSNYGIEIDLPDQKVNLYAADHCPGRVVYWDSEYFKMPFDRGDRPVPKIKITVALDGHQLHGILDTGAGNTALRLGTARSVFGYDETQAGDQTYPMSGAAVRRVLTAYRHQFASLEFGAITLRNPMIAIAPFDAAKTSAPEVGSHINTRKLDQPEIYVGMDVISKLRMFIDYRESALYFTLAKPPAAAPR
jgi:predicted aspartyl protease